MRLYVKISLTALVLCGAVATGNAFADSYADLRLAMVSEIEADARRTSIYIDKKALDQRVMQAMASVPRHEFVRLDEKPDAYKNRPLPIGYGQTISQPYIVALMTDLLKPAPNDTVLEVGTGSGYQAAILARVVKQVYSIEIIEELGEQAASRFKQLGIQNVTSRISDGYYGWEEKAPFDAIVVTAASTHVPAPLIQQLKPGGRMVIPVGGSFQVQQLMMVEKTREGKVTTRQILPVRFVPLTGEH